MLQRPGAGAGAGLGVAQQLLTDVQRTVAACGRGERAWDVGEGRCRGLRGRDGGRGGGGGNPSLRGSEGAGGAFVGRPPLCIAPSPLKRCWIAPTQRHITLKRVWERVMMGIEARNRNALSEREPQFGGGGGGGG